jgi:hypothetical protein
MATYYCGPNGSDSNDGSESTPFLTDIPFVTGASDGDILKVPCGYVIDRALNADDTNVTFGASGLTIESYGTGEKPVFTRAIRSPSFAADSNGTFSYALSGNYGGFIAEDDRPMTPVTWNTNIATTAAAMAAGTMTFDPVGFKYYIKPSSGNPSNHSYIVSGGAKIWNATGKSRITIRGIAWAYAGQGPFFYDGGGLLIEDFHARNIGGWYGPGADNIQGDGITVGGNTGTARTIVRDGTFEDILDCGFKPQQWENSKTLANIVVERCTALRCGQHAFGASVIGSLTNSSVSNVVFRNCIAEDVGLGYGGNRGGVGFNFGLTTTDAGSSVTGCSVSACEVRRAYLGGRAIGCDIVFSGLWAEGIITQGILFDRGARGGNMRAQGCMFVSPANATGSAIWHNGSAVGGGVQADNCTIHGAWLRGQMVNLTGGTHTTKNTIHVGCTTGINRNNPAVTPVATKCLFWQCSTNTSGTTNTTPVLTDPQLGTDYSIPATSPCKGAGVYIPGAKHFGGHSMSVVSPDIGARRYFAPRATVNRG